MKKHQPRRPNRRLRDHNYASVGTYFLTLVTQNRAHWFGRIVQGDMQLNNNGCIAHEAWQATANIRPEISLWAFVVMPNHLHALIHINIGTENEVPTKFTSPKKTIGAIVRGYKGMVVRQIRAANQLESSPKVWQANYNERIVHGKTAYQNIRYYIQTNPQRWEKDRLK